MYPAVALRGSAGTTRGRMSLRFRAGLRISAPAGGARHYLHRAVVDSGVEARVAPGVREPARPELGAVTLAQAPAWRHAAAARMRYRGYSDGRRKRIRRPRSAEYR